MGKSGRIAGIDGRGVYTRANESYIHLRFRCVNILEYRVEG
jgi:hypothetical protein